VAHVVTTTGRHTVVASGQEEEGLRASGPFRISLLRDVELTQAGRR
jgi:hypothetical protein